MTGGILRALEMTGVSFVWHLGCDFRVKMEMSHNGTDTSVTLEHSIVVQCTKLTSLNANNMSMSQWLQIECELQASGMHFVHYSEQ